MFYTNVLSMTLTFVCAGQHVDTTGRKSVNYLTTNYNLCDACLIIRTESVSLNGIVSPESINSRDNREKSKV